jgi:hypothetical protein
MGGSSTVPTRDDFVDLSQHLIEVIHPVLDVANLLLGLFIHSTLFSRDLRSSLIIDFSVERTSGREFCLGSHHYSFELSTLQGFVILDFYLQLLSPSYKLSTSGCRI